MVRHQYSSVIWLLFKMMMGEWSKRDTCSLVLWKIEQHKTKIYREITYSVASKAFSGQQHTCMNGFSMPLRMLMILWIGLPKRLAYLYTSFRRSCFWQGSFIEVSLQKLQKTYSSIIITKLPLILTPEVVHGGHLWARST